MRPMISNYTSKGTVEKKEAILQLWNKFIKSQNLNAKHQLIMNYIWLVKYVLKQMNLPTNTILTEEDFLNIGILGLHEAILRYDLERGVKFESYAIPRIKGIIQDELRKLDWLSRSARKKAHDYIKAGDELRSEKGREVTAEEIRKKLDVNPDKYQAYLNAAAAAKASLSLVESNVYQYDNKEDSHSLIEEVPDNDQETMLDQLENEERIGFLTDFLKDLPERKRLVMTLYYYESLTFKEIGNVLNVSESRVCQIHTQVVQTLRTQLNEFDNA